MRPDFARHAWFSRSRGIRVGYPHPTELRPGAWLEGPCGFFLFRRQGLTCLGQLLVQLAIANCRDERVDHTGKLVGRRHCDSGFAFLELNRLLSDADGQNSRSVWKNSPPREHSLFLFDLLPLSLLFGPYLYDSGVARVLKQSFLLFKMSNGSIAAVHHWVGLNLRKKHNGEGFERSHDVLL